MLNNSYHFQWSSSALEIYHTLQLIVQYSLSLNTHTMHVAGKFGSNNAWQKWMNENFNKKVWRMNRSDIRLSIVTTDLDGFRLGNCG